MQLARWDTILIQHPESKIISGTLWRNIGGQMATIRKKAGKWQGLIRRSFHKPISKTFISKQDAHRWARED